MAQRPGTLFVLNDAPYGTERSYNGLRLAGALSKHGGEVGVCATCMDARGIADTELTDTAHCSSLEELTNWVQWADRTLVF
ncbi:MAG: DsrE family protein [Vicinamibacterales bacterium]